MQPAVLLGVMAGDLAMATVATKPRIVALALCLAVLGPFIGLVTLLVSLALSGTTWESANAGSDLHYLAVLIVFAWGLVAFGMVKRLGARTWPSLAAAVLTVIWSISLFPILAMLS